MTYSDKTIQETLKQWQPHYDKLGVKLTERDAVEIIDNLSEFFKILNEWDKEEKKKLEARKFSCEV